MAVAFLYKIYYNSVIWLNKVAEHGDVLDSRDLIYHTLIRCALNDKIKGAVQTLAALPVTWKRNNICDWKGNIVKVPGYMCSRCEF